MRPRPLALPLAVLAAGAAVALPIASGGAQSPPRTIKVTFAGDEKMFLDDAAPRTLKRGRLTLGDRIVGTQPVLVDGKPGTLHTDATVTNRHPTSFAHFKSLLQGTLHTAGGDLYFIGFVDAANGGDRSAIVGGNGQYAGARGNVVGSEKGAVITLDS